MGTLPKPKAALAWRLLAMYLEELSDRDIPKFKDLIKAIRRANIVAKTEAAKKFIKQL